jgi:hypothetical protein
MRSWWTLLVPAVMLGAATAQPVAADAGFPAASRAATTCPLGSKATACEVRPPPSAN